MASAYSILRNYGDYIQPFDFNLIQKGLEYKQNKFDINTMKIEQTINQFATMDLARDIDKEYLYNRVNKLVNNVNSVQGADYSSNGFTRMIRNHLGEALDDTVMNAYKSTQNLRNYQKQVADIKKNKPELYSKINEAYGMRGARAWLQSNDLNATYGGSTYIPYTDVDGKKQKLLADLYKNSKSTIERRLGDGTIIQEEVQGLSGDQISTILSQSLDANEQSQMAINAWGTYGQNPEAASQIFNRYAENRKLELDRGLQNAKAKGDKKLIKFYNDAQESFNRQVEDLKGNPNQIGLFLEKERLQGSMKSQFLKRRVGFKYKNDQAFWEQRKDVRANKRFALESAKLQLDIQKERAKAAKGKGLTSSNVNLSTESTKLNPIDAQKMLDEKSNTLKSNTASNLSALYKTSLRNYKDDIQRDLEVFMEANPNADRKAQEFRIAKQYINDNKIKSTKTDDFLLAESNYFQELEDNDKLYEEAVNQFSEGVRNAVNVVGEQDNANIREKYNRVLPFRLVSKQEFDNASFSDQTNMRTVDNLSEDERDELERVALADVINSKVRSNDTKALNYYVSALANKLGDRGSVKIEQETFQVKTFDGFENRTRNRIKVEGGDRFLNYLQNTNNNGIFDTFNIGNDNSIVEDSDFGIFLDEDLIQDKFNSFISDKVVQRTGISNINIRGAATSSGVEKNPEIKAFYFALNQGLTSKDANFIRRGETKIRPLEDLSEEELKSFKFSPNAVGTIISDESKVGKGMYGLKLSTGGTLIVPRSQVNPILEGAGIKPTESSINRASQFLSSNRTFENDLTLFDKQFIDNNSDYVSDVIKSNPSYKGILTKNSILDTLQRKYGTLKKEGQITEEGNAITSILDNVENLKMDLKLKDGNITTNFYNKDGEYIHSLTYPKELYGGVQEAEQQYRNLSKTLFSTPQVFLFGLIDQVIRDERKETYPEITIQQLNSKINGE